MVRSTALSDSSEHQIHLRDSLGLVGDLWSLFGSRMDDYIARNDVLRLIEIGQTLDDPVVNYLGDQLRGAPPPLDNEMNTDE